MCGRYWQSQDTRQLAADTRIMHGSREHLVIFRFAHDALAFEEMNIAPAQSLFEPLFSSNNAS